MTSDRKYTVDLIDSPAAVEKTNISADNKIINTSVVPQADMSLIQTPSLPYKVASNRSISFAKLHLEHTTSPINSYAWKKSYQSLPHEP